MPDFWSEPLAILRYTTLAKFTETVAHQCLAMVDTAVAPQKSLQLQMDARRPTLCMREATSTAYDETRMSEIMREAGCSPKTFGSAETPREVPASPVVKAECGHLTGKGTVRNHIL